MASATFAQNNTVVASSSDSLSYAAGVMVTNGLHEYMQNNFGIKAENYKDFVEGFKQSLLQAPDAKNAARINGWQIGEQLKNTYLSKLKSEFTDTPDSIVMEVLVRGFVDAVLGNASITVEEADKLFKEKENFNKAAKEEKLSKPGKDFLAQNAKKKKVITTESGLQYKVLVKGKGEVPQATDEVKVHYEGRLIDGTVFDASAKHGTEPMPLKANQVIKGWQEALTMMPVGSKWQLYIPYTLAYGSNQAGNIPPYSALIFDIELVDIVKK